MKKVTTISIGRCGLRFFSGALLLALALSLVAQKNFNQEERETMEKYKRAKVHYLKGVEYLGKGKLEKVQKEADACLEIFPGYSDAHMLMAQLQYQQGQYETALKEIETAKADFGAIKKFYYVSFQDYIDRLREERDQKDSRIQELTMEMTKTQNPTTRQQLQSTIDQAKAILATIDSRLRDWIPTAIDIPAEYQYIHGNILFKMKRYSEAQGFYLAAVQADPRHASAYNNLISFYFACKDAANALKYLKQAEDNGVTVNEKLKKAVLELQ
jgi:tetratricopeptide (TPR) repeat protein